MAPRRGRGFSMPLRIRGSGRDKYLKEFHKERAEHPTLPNRSIDIIVRDHLRKMRR
jgi:hypothetical protein